MAKTPKTKNYDADSIDVHLGLDGVRQNSNIYIGNPDTLGILQIAKEPIENAYDEASEGHGNYIGVVIEKDDTVWVFDEGRGIPVEKHKVTGVSTLTTVLTTLSAGGKMRHGKEGKNESSYKFSRGVHGMGVSITNALSSLLVVWTFRDGKWWTQSFKKGKPVADKPVLCKAPKIPLIEDKLANRKSGTVIKYQADLSIFDKGSILDRSLVKTFLDLSSYLRPSVKTYYADHKGSKLYYQPDGLVAYTNRIIANAKVDKIGKAFTFSNEILDIACNWAASDEVLIETFVNCGPTIEHGTHYNGMVKAIAESLAPYAGKRDSKKYKPEDLLVGLAGILNARVSTPRFTGQTKEKLATPEAATFVYEALKKPLIDFWKKNTSTAKEIVKRAVALREAVQEFTLNKQAVTKIRSKKDRALLPSKLCASTTRDPDQRELFLVEGESAGGTAADARDMRYQEVLKLRGKVVNAFGSKAAKVFANKAVLDILRAIGYDSEVKPNAKDRMKLRVGKIIMLTDPDVDGEHITVLLLTVLQRILPKAFFERRVYVVDAPLFNAFHKGKRYYGESVEAVMKQLPKGTKLQEGVQRIKGWGEVKAPVLEEVAFNPKTRKLTLVKEIEGEKLAAYASIVGGKPEARRKLLGL